MRSSVPCVDGGEVMPNGHKGYNGPINQLGKAGHLCPLCTKIITCECSWMKDRNPKPVEGWDAMEMQQPSGRRDRTVTYRVLSCPEFVETKRRKDV